MRRNTNDIPVDANQAAGVHIDRNPGCVCIWIVGQTDFKIMRLQSEPGVQAGILFRLGRPKEVLWFANGRPARRQEIMDSINSGYPKLAEAANRDGVKAALALNELKQEAMRLLPTA